MSATAMICGRQAERRRMNLGRVGRLLHVQLQAAAVLGSTFDLPGAGAIARFSRTPQSEDAVLGGVATTIVRPSSSPPWPTLVFANGATPDGRAHPMVFSLSLALARSGYLVFIPDLPGVAQGELSPATLAASTDFAEAAAHQAESADGRVALAGVSVGASLALLTAASPQLAERISVVACVAPYGDLVSVALLATTGAYRRDGRFEPYPVPAYLWLGLARSLTALLPPTQETETLYAELCALDPAAADGVAHFRQRPFDAFGEQPASLFALLANRDPARFDALYAALPARLRAAIESLSPLRTAHRLRSPVEIATAPRDRYFPVAESLALASASPRVRLTVTSLLAHAAPRLSTRYLGELGRLNGFFVRALEAAR